MNISRKDKLFALILVVSILSSVFTTSFLSVGFANHEPAYLDVKIQPENAKMSPHQTLEFYASVLNGSTPFAFEWQYQLIFNNGTSGNRTQFGVSFSAVNFTLEESCKEIIISVRVTNNFGDFGFDSVTVLDPTAFTISAGIYPGASKCTIWADGATFYSKNQYGAITSGLVAATLIQDSWAAMSRGGEIFVTGIINLGSTPLVLNLAKYQKDLVLSGEGDTATQFVYSGSGSAITIDTLDPVPGYYNFKLADFMVNCTSLTSGRDGISLNVGRLGVIDHITIYFADDALILDDDMVNCVSSYGLNIVVANTGVRCGTVSNANEFSFYYSRIVSTVNYGMLISGSSSVTVFAGSIAPATGVGIYTNGSLGTVLEGVHFENVAGSCDVDVNGVSGFPSESTSIRSCYFNSPVEYAVKISNADGLTIDSPNTRSHTIAPFYISNLAQNFVIINPVFAETYLFDSASLTMLSTRQSGTVITKYGTGIVVTAGEAGLTAGKVASLTYTAGLVYLADESFNPRNMKPIIYASSASGKPLVILQNGFFPSVSTEGSVSAGDTLVASTTDGFAKANNNVTDPKLILGYALGSNSGSATDVFIP